MNALASFYEGLKKAYDLGYEGRKIELELVFIVGSRQKIDPASSSKVSALRQRLKEIRFQEEKMGILEKLAFGFGNTPEV